MKKENTYILFDDKYFSQGYLIINEVDGEIVKFIKISIENQFGFFSYFIRGYEKGSVDEDDKPYRKIEFVAKKGEPLYEPLNNLARSLNDNSILSIDSVNHGENKLYVSEEEDKCSLVLMKDVMGVKKATDFIDLVVGESGIYSENQPFDNFYKELYKISLGVSKDSDISKLLKLTSSN